MGVERQYGLVHASQQACGNLAIQSAGGDGADDPGEGCAEVGAAGEPTEIGRVPLPAGCFGNTLLTAAARLAASMEVAETFTGECYGPAAMAVRLNVRAKSGWQSVPPEVLQPPRYLIIFVIRELHEICRKVLSLNML